MITNQRYLTIFKPTSLLDVSEYIEIQKNGVLRETQIHFKSLAGKFVFNHQNKLISKSNYQSYFNLSF